MKMLWPTWCRRVRQRSLAGRVQNKLPLGEGHRACPRETTLGLLSVGPPSLHSSPPHVGSCRGPGQVQAHMCSLTCMHVAHTLSTHVCNASPPTCGKLQGARPGTGTHVHMHTHPQTPLQALTLSLGSRLMVLSGRSTRRTLSDLMVLMSFPLEPLEGRSHPCRQGGSHLCPEDLGTGSLGPAGTTGQYIASHRLPGQGLTRVDGGWRQVSNTWCTGRAEHLGGTTSSLHPQHLPPNQLPPATVLRPAVGIKGRAGPARGSP